ncbi:hypothetical protein LTR94_035439, partial [Friedmanniomyces endolithicus]
MPAQGLIRLDEDLKARRRRLERRGLEDDVAHIGDQHPAHAGPLGQEMIEGGEPLHDRMGGPAVHARRRDGLDAGLFQQGPDIVARIDDQGRRAREDAAQGADERRD